MFCEIITIGDELLIGQVVDTNSAWMAEQLNLIGVRVKQISSVSDERQHIKNAIKEAEGRADIILMTGGLGPTNDDITKETLCEYFGTSLVFDDASFNHINELFSKRGLAVNELNHKQAEVPANCIPIANKSGTAPGMWFEENGKIYVSMPGVPFEMKDIMTSFVLPKLKERVKNVCVLHRTILTQGIGESFLAEKIADWENKLPPNIKLAYLPDIGRVRLRLTAVGNVEHELKQLLKSNLNVLHELICHYIYGYETDTLQEVVQKLMLEKKLSLATAESCTGGYLSHLITSVPGSSAYYRGSIIAYSYDVKEQVLLVPHDMLLKYGAVSEEVVLEMAKNVKTLLSTDCSISISGIAGPGGATPDKPIGTVWIAASFKEQYFSKKFLFGNRRDHNIIRAGQEGLNMLRKLLIRG